MSHFLSPSTLRSFKAVSTLTMLLVEFIPFNWNAQFEVHGHCVVVWKKLFNNNVTESGKTEDYW